MPIDHFTREQFESALPKRRLTLPGQPDHCWTSSGLVKGEYVYSIPVCYAYGSTWVEVRSSVGSTGIAADTGEDSIRLYLMGPMGAVAGKLTKYVTRVKGWDKRMTDQLRTLYKIGLSLKPCPTCGDLMHAFTAGKGKNAKAKPENVGRLFQRCVRKDARGKGQDGCPHSFEWIDFKDGKK